jgi:hypothetical protein
MPLPFFDDIGHNLPQEASRAFAAGQSGAIARIARMG